MTTYVWPSLIFFISFASTPSHHSCWDLGSGTVQRRSNALSSAGRQLKDQSSLLTGDIRRVLQAGISQIHSSSPLMAEPAGGGEPWGVLRLQLSVLWSSLSQQPVWAEKPFYSLVAPWPPSSLPILPPKGNTAVTRQQHGEWPEWCAQFFYESYVCNIFNCVKSL